MTWLHTFVGAWLVALSFAFIGCDRPSSESVNPKILRIAFVPQVDMEERYEAAYRALERYLEPRLGLPVEVVSLESVTAALEGLRAGKLDVCNFSPWPFLLAESKVGVEPLLVTGRSDGEPVSYRSLLVARPELGLKSGEDLKALARELVFSFEEPVSTSGHLVPRAYLHALGINPERDFKRMLFSPDSTVSILAVKAKRLDVVAVSDTSLARAIDRKRIVAADVAVLWTSPPVLSNLVAIRRKLPDAFKTRVRDAFLKMPEAAPAEWAQVTRQYSQPVSRYLPATEAMLRPFRDAIRDVPGLQIAL